MEEIHSIQDKVTMSINVKNPDRGSVRDNTHQDLGSTVVKVHLVAYPGNSGGNECSQVSQREFGIG